MKKRKKKLARGKVPIVRRKPLRPGDKVTVKSQHDIYHGRQGIVHNPPYRRFWDRYLVKVKFAGDSMVYDYHRRNLADVTPESKLSHDYYTMITGGLDAILGTES